MKKFGGGYIVPTGPTTQPTTGPAIITQDSNGHVYILPTAGSRIQFFSGTSTVRLNQNGFFDFYKGIQTAGLGVPAIYAASIQNPSNAAPTTVSYTPPATAGTYRLSYYLDITTATTITFKIKGTYTDPNGTARSPNLPFMLDGAAGATSVQNGTPFAANTAGQAYGSITFGIDNSATAITVADNAGTYTTCNYRWQVILEQLA